MALKWSNGKGRDKLHADAAQYIKGKINELLLTEDEIAAGKTEKESKFLFCYKALQAP
ncbi:uncharacterized protein EHS24_008219 [Apiotrichum porosum]|uniref:Uncharacterized protein n=1 Tax=Apiotrichum porosum TaxID=105984 RepID=A0A427XT72_9TREE|nr:uncharacterized protein EHS24_008219 [Apiotrichum porosum]RSH82015.1 hypothetical protein EHS24_008219 [Apiotrichum porosum]